MSKMDVIAQIIGVEKNKPFRCYMKLGRLFILRDDGIHMIYERDGEEVEEIDTDSTCLERMLCGEYEVLCNKMNKKIEEDK